MMSQCNVNTIMLLHYDRQIECNPFGGKPSKAREPLFWTNQPANQLLAEKLKYSHNRAQQRQRFTNNIIKVWQNLAPFGGSPLGSAVELLLTKVLNWQPLTLLIVVFYVAAAVSVV
jgi:hypothetical protein